MQSIFKEEGDCKVASEGLGTGVDENIRAWTPESQVKKKIPKSPDLRGPLPPNVPLARRRLSEGKGFAVDTLIKNGVQLGRLRNSRNDTQNPTE